MKTGFLTIVIMLDSLTFEMQNLSVSVLSLLARYIGRREREELVPSTTQIERSIPDGDKLQWTHGSDELNLFLL